MHGPWPHVVITAGGSKACPISCSSKGHAACSLAWERISVLSSLGILYSVVWEGNFVHTLLCTSYSPHFSISTTHCSHTLFCTLCPPHAFLHTLLSTHCSPHTGLCALLPTPCSVHAAPACPSIDTAVHRHWSPHCCPSPHYCPLHRHWSPHCLV